MLQCYVENFKADPNETFNNIIILKLWYVWLFQLTCIGIGDVCNKGKVSTNIDMVDNSYLFINTIFFLTIFVQIMLSYIKTCYFLFILYFVLIKNYQLIVQCTLGDNDLVDFFFFADVKGIKEILDGHYHLTAIVYMSWSSWNTCTFQCMFNFCLFCGKHFT